MESDGDQELGLVKMMLWEIQVDVIDVIERRFCALV